MVDDEDFDSWYGPWARLDPEAVAGLLADLDVDWWVSGGWAVERFTAVPREHHDMDVGVFADDLAEVLACLGGTHQVWAGGGGALRPLTDPADLPDWADRLWVRERADAPWQLDMGLTRRWQDQWVYRHDPTVTMPLAEATWTSKGIRYLRPEIVLLSKARRPDAPRGKADLAAIVPWLDARARQWLADRLGSLDPQHPWLARL
ncbi:hypothetical protein F0L68_10460 [Solihabitans fulvus]|uniref:Aminoglycoside-2''-adenylyltransferase n=1 Tax=Solihabitans fulvus TaxID=1892852 RepID=A0A5B2XJ29_9PSEU|nr:hypothetical protein [Solihabitans fulvus]KAA2263234.1 hypothetical protein F0L68_10460 [Solihabitans fulvus]